MLTEGEKGIIKVCDFGIAGICSQGNSDPTSQGFKCEK